MNTVSVIGLVLCLVVLVLLCMHNVNIYICGIVCSVILALFSGMNVYTTLKDLYMPGFVSFLQSWFLLFALGTLYGKILDVTGAAERVAKVIMQVAGKKRALIALPIAIGTLVYCGVNGFICMFIAWPIMTEIFRELDVPKRLMPALYFLSSGTFANFGPGTPQILNLISTQALGVSPMAGLIPGICACAVAMIVGPLWFRAIAEKCKKNGEHFVELEEKNETAAERELPGVLPSILPLLVTIVCVNLKVNGTAVFQLEYAIALGALTAILANWKYLDKEKLVPYIGEAAESTISLIGMTCAIVGFGYVVKGSPAFQTLVDLIPKIPGPPIISLWVATNLMCAITGTASGAAAIVAPILGPIYVNMGLNPELVARTMVTGATAFDSVPHNGTVVFTIKMCGESHKTAYWPLFQMSVLLPMLCSLACMVVGSIIY